MARIDLYHTRSTEPEWMDDVSRDAEEMHQTLSELEKVNKLLGGVGPSVRMIHKAVDRLCTNQPITVCDIGSGAGDILRAVARKSKNADAIHCVGMDYNPDIVDYANEHIKGIANITFEVVDVFDKTVDWSRFDIIHLSLVLHHFSDEEIGFLFNRFREAGVRCILINDLQRSKIAYGLFTLFSRIMGFSKMARHDGLISIQKGFTKGQLKDYLLQSGYENAEVRWKWAFRYTATTYLQNEEKQ